MGVCPRDTLVLQATSRCPRVWGLGHHQYHVTSILPSLVLRPPHSPDSIASTPLLQYLGPAPSRTPVWPLRSAVLFRLSPSDPVSVSRRVYKINTNRKRKKPPPFPCPTFPLSFCFSFSSFFCTEKGGRWWGPGSGLSYSHSYSCVSPACRY